MKTSVSIAALVLGVGALAVAGCNKKQEVAYHTDLPVKEVMAHVIDPASWTFWRASGDVVDAEGTHSLLPTTEEGWENAVTGATTIAEGANLLLLPGREAPGGDGKWKEYANQLYVEAMKGREAAENHDGEAMFTTGASIYQVCTACHAQYIEEEKHPAETKGLPALPDMKKK